MSLSLIIIKIIEKYKTQSNPIIVKKNYCALFIFLIIIFASCSKSTSSNDCEKEYNICKKNAESFLSQLGLNQTKEDYQVYLKMKEYCGNTYTNCSGGSIAGAPFE